jgi:ubiquinone/menaquinone biosynthesis C-methylase UbiE
VIDGVVTVRHFADDTFDAVTMSHFIEHVRHPHAPLRECYRILKPGGRLVIVIANTYSVGIARTAILCGLRV